MKWNFLLLYLLFLHGYSQIILTSDDLPQAGSSYIRAISNPASITISPGGANQTWDYSNLMELSRDTIFFVSPSQTPLAYQFYFQNPILYPDYYASFSQQAESINLFNQVSLTDRYIYYKLDTAYKVVGFGANINGVPTSVKYDDIEELLPLPLQYGQQRNYSGAYLVTIPQMGTYGQFIKRTIQADAYGTLLLPSGTYSALRTVTTLNVEDTVFYSGSGFGIKVPRPTQTIYQWWGKNQGIPLLELIITDNTPSQAYYKISGTSTLDTTKDQIIYIFFNPFSKKVQFFIPHEKRILTTIEIYAPDGTLLHKMPYQPEWDTQHLTPGIYFIKVQIDNSIYGKPLLILN